MDEDLEKYIEQGETYRQDFKRKAILDHSSDLAKHLVAFANRQGGRILFGVDDDGKIAGEDIVHRINEKLISNVSTKYCEPPVRHWVEFKSEQTGPESNTGDVLILHIHPYREIPHAVIHEDSLENQFTRTYYIRTGESSRPIGNSHEINQLFSNENDPDDEEYFQSWIFFDIDDLYYTHCEPTPESNGYFHQVFTYMSDEDREYLKSGEGPSIEHSKSKGLSSEKTKVSRLIRECAPFIMLVFLASNLHWTGKNSSVGAQELEKNTESIDSRAIIENDEPEIISNTSIEPRKFLLRSPEKVRVPEGTDVEIWYNLPESDKPSKKYIGDDSHRGVESQLVFKKRKYYQIRIGFPRVNHGLVPGFPEDYPQYFDQKFREKIEKETVSKNLPVRFSKRYGFPDVEDAQIDIHRSFGDQLQTLIRDGWSWNQFLELVPDQEIYKIQENLHQVKSKLDDLAEDSDNA